MTPGATFSDANLVRAMNLTTGQATLIGDIGPTANPILVRSLALRLRRPAMDK
jgi:hypothetical protein